MSVEATLSAEALLEQLRGRFEQLCRDVAGAVNQAPAGRGRAAPQPRQVRRQRADPLPIRNTQVPRRRPGSSSSPHCFNRRGRSQAGSAVPQPTR